MTTKKERSKFEAEVIAQHGNDESLERSDDGYTDSEVDFAWSIWKASRNTDGEPAANDREVLTSLMDAFDSESWVCKKCGHEDSTSDMDSAIMLREYLTQSPRIEDRAASADRHADVLRQYLRYLRSANPSQSLRPRMCDIREALHQVLDSLTSATPSAKVDRVVTVPYDDAARILQVAYTEGTKGHGYNEAANQLYEAAMYSTPSAAAGEEMSEADRVEFALSDAGFDYDRACAIAHPAPSAAVGDGQAIGHLTISRFRGADSMVNHDFDYYGDLPDGSYSVYITPTKPGHMVDVDVSIQMPDLLAGSGTEPTIREMVRRYYESAFDKEMSRIMADRLIAMLNATQAKES